MKSYLSLFLLISTGLLYADIDVILETRGSQTKEIRVQKVIQTEGTDTRRISIQVESREEFLLGPDGVLKEYFLKTKDLNIKFIKYGSFLNYEGWVNGTSKKGRIETMGVAWFGGFELGLKTLMEKKMDRLTFLLPSPAKPGSVVEMEFTKEGPEKIGDKQAFRVKVGLTGFMAPFWSAMYWVSPEGNILRYKGDQGPGTETFQMDYLRTEHENTP